LQLTFLLRNGNLARASHDIALGLFHDLLDYKAFQAGIQLVKVNPRNTSQMCSACGAIVPKTLFERVHSCPHCGFTADRDVNAALNILSIGWDASVKRQRSGLPQA
jgi:putative transposase